MKNVVREKKIYCGNYMEVDIYNHTMLTTMRKGRAKKEKVSAPKQRNLNDKNARRYFIQLVNTNFGKEDLHVSLTYAEAPETVEAAEKEVSNYLRRVAHRRKREGLPPLKYVLVTEGGNEKSQEKKKRIHHHIIMNGGLERDVVENLWRRPKKKGQQKGDWIGFVNADRLKPNDYGLEAVARYLMKSPNGKKRWSSSQNLEKPEYRFNDFKYSKRQVEKIVRDEIDNQHYWKKKYPEWDVTEVKPVYTEINGWSIYLKLRRSRE
ncbi:hypothetical protein M5X00_29825 [Paenibacillus alvei]|uniref:rolling circle replication-associated protein n=1 Tax=Paenibacillus alvei TaxID=44250 RepID=UPI00028925D2|nr:hypothetical protein [Paenibacillus alvei]EJW14533.1 hypothetical protein PAV_13c01520 [Paenibacillus alvei DSM 29]MCY9540010.1 hypothetical protein [Paenibacillus alvei]MCY9708356.1 hypothetical protein [Paenibacillus alvei]MCY9738073.1 hypothetical protein [Paenibacillus alvei]MCY9758421.1 hypothetical protein [Paenibacillus alvei]